MYVLYRVTVEINVWFLVTSTACFCLSLDLKIRTNAPEPRSAAPQSIRIHIVCGPGLFPPKGSDGNFYLQGLHTVVADLFSFGGGCIL